MNENQIDTFLAIAQHGSFSRAAQSLYISQPAVTYRIRMLEEELGAKLFECGAFYTVLTPAGEAFLEEAQHLSDAFYQTRKKMLRYSPEHTITLGFPAMMIQDGRSFLSIMNRCSQALGGHEGRLVQSRQLEKDPLNVQQLVRGEADLIFTDLGLDALQGDRFERRWLFEVKMRACMHKAHPLAEKKCLRLSDLQGQTIYLYEDLSSFPMRVRQMLREKNIEPDVQGFPSFVQLLPKLLLDGSVTITNLRPIEHEELVYLPLDLEKSINIGIAWMKERSTPRLRQMVHVIESIPWESWM